MVEKIKQCIDLINENKAMEYIKPKDCNNMMAVGYYTYNDSLMQVLYELSQGVDNYKSYQLFKDKNIEDYTLAECKIFATYLVRGERFCDGLIAESIENKSMSRLLSRYLDIC